MKNKQIIFITATNTSVGKTRASEIFLKKYAKNGHKVGYFKPIETGVKTIPEDGAKLLKIAQNLNPDFENISINDVVPYMFELPASPYVAKGTSIIDINIIKNKAKKLLDYCDTLIIEGAGGLMVPIKINYFMYDLIKEFECKTVLISPSNLGSINDTLLSMELLKNKKIPFDWYINIFKDKNSFYETTLPFYKDYFDKIQFLEEDLT